MAADGSEAQLTSGLSYNPIFGELVGDSAEINDNLVGVVAYGIYKIAKREWLTEFKARCGREPTTEEVTNYTLTWTKSRKDALTFAAESSLAKFADTIISDAAPGIREAALRGTFWSAVWTSIFASALITRGRRRWRARPLRTREFLICIRGMRNSRQEYHRSFSMPDGIARSS